jgi:hypothetical protein
MVELSTSGAPARQWDRLCAEADATAMQPHERSELLELRALAAQRAGDLERTCALLEEASCAAASRNLVADRAARRLERMRHARG